MDPRSLVDRIVHEAALDGVYGMSTESLWAVCASETGQEIDEDLKTAIWHWISRNSDLSIRNDTLFASEELQWQTLTGSAKEDNIVGQLTFDLLSLIAHHRAVGVSTVEASRETGQDLRSLFGRVQTLVNLGLVRRFPVIEHGSSTNRMVFREYVGSHNVTDDAVDKQAIAADIAAFCRSGSQGIRSTREIVREIGSKLVGTKKSRRRPTVMGCLRFLEGVGSVRRVSMVHPQYPDRYYSCVEFVRDFDPAQGGESSQLMAIVGADGVIRGPSSGTQNGDEDEEEDADLDDDNDDENEEEDDDNMEDKVRVSEGETRPAATTVMPLVNQIYDAISLRGSTGISAMELTRLLTGNLYRKALGKFLDGITAAPSSRGNGGGGANNTNTIPQLGYLGLVKGVDFNRRVKFYRYFTKIAYDRVQEPPQEWGEFPTSLGGTGKTSPQALEQSLLKPLPGACSIVRDPEGVLRPVFHGDKSVVGETVLKSEPSTGLGSAAASTPQRKRGRPRKNEAVETKAETPKPPQPVLFRKWSDRVWTGGTPVASPQHASRWLAVPPPKDSTAVPQIKLEPEVHETATSEDSKFMDVDEPPQQSQQQEHEHEQQEEQPQRRHKPSLAYQRRAEVLMRIVEESNGAVPGGAPLLEKFNAAVTAGEYAVDRRTVHNVVDRLVSEGRLQKIYVSVSTASGKHVMKFLVYDPARIRDPSTSPVIRRAKQELSEGNREKHVAATKAALDAAKDALKSLPQRQMTAEHMEAFGPKLMRAPPGRMLTTTSSKTATATRRERTRFGPSAAEVLGVDREGRVPKPRTKRAATSTEAIPIAPKPAAAKPAAANQVAANQAADVTEPAGQQRTTKPRRRDRSRDTDIDLDRLARSVIVFRSLVTTNIDWKTISAIVGGPSAAECRRKWQDARSYLETQTSQGADAVFNKSKEFESLFLAAYKRGLIAFEFGQDPVAAIPHYVDWWKAAETEGLAYTLVDNEGHTGDAGQQQLSEHQANGEDTAVSRAELQLSRLVLRPREPDATQIDPLASLQSQPSIVNAERLLVNTSFGVPVTSSTSTAHQIQQQPRRLTDNEMRLRAVIAADDDSSYSPERAARELVGLSNGDTEIAKAGLEMKRVIQWGENDHDKVPTGRPFVLNDQVLNALTVPKLDLSIPRKLAEGMQHFVNSTESMHIPSTVDECDMIGLLELSTFGLHGRYVRLRRTGEKFGLISVDYKSRGIDKQEFECGLECDLVVGKPDSLDSPESADTLGVPPPQSNNIQRPWLWETRNLSSRNIWLRIEFKILATVHFRPGITVEALAMHLRNALEFDETEAAVSALCDAGALSRTGLAGLTAAPNWFEYLASEA